MMGNLVPAVLVRPAHKIPSHHVPSLCAQGVTQPHPYVGHNSTRSKPSREPAGRRGRRPLRRDTPHQCPMHTRSITHKRAAASRRRRRGRRRRRRRRSHRIRTRHQGGRRRCGDGGDGGRDSSIGRRHPHGGRGGGGGRRHAERYRRGPSTRRRQRRHAGAERRPRRGEGCQSCAERRRARRRPNATDRRADSRNAAAAPGR